MALLTQSKNEPFGLRPMNPMRDLRGVADLIEEAFADDLDHSGQNALQELRWLSYFKPLLWWMLLINFERSDFLSGFVWTEDGRIVGNITVNQMAPASRRWMISNVAVADAYRRRGIAARLLSASLDLVSRYHGETVLLQVRADNSSALKLYQAHQFRQITGTVHLHSPSTPVMPIVSLPDGVILRERRVDWQDNQAVYQLVKSTVPAQAQQEWPIRQYQIRLDSSHQFQNFFRRLINRGVAYWVVETKRRVIAFVTIEPGIWNQTHHIDLMVHPEWRGHIEEAIISRALQYLHRRANYRVIVKQPIDQAHAVAIFKQCGFQEEQTLLWMKRAM